MNNFIVIAHRGNIEGKNETSENEQYYCQRALDKGYDVEIDVWKKKGWWSGHTKPQYEVDEDFLLKEGVWCHAKDIETLYRLQLLGAHCFFHQREAVTLTSAGYIWTFPLEKLTLNSICVMPELQRMETMDRCAGVCTDYANTVRGWND